MFIPSIKYSKLVFRMKEHERKQTSPNEHGKFLSKTAYKRSLSLNSDQKKELSSLIGDNNNDKIKLDNSSSKLGPDLKIDWLPQIA